MFWVFRVCVCVHVRVHVYMRGKELHILVYSSLLSIYQCRWALCCMGKVKCKRLAIAKTKLKAIFFILLGFITVLYLVPMSGESFYILKKSTNSHTEANRKLSIWAECFLVSPVIVKHNEALSRNRGSDGFELFQEDLEMPCRLPNFWFSSQDGKQIKVLEVKLSVNFQTPRRSGWIITSKTTPLIKCFSHWISLEGHRLAPALHGAESWAVSWGYIVCFGQTSNLIYTDLMHESFLLLAGRISTSWMPLGF